MQRWVEETLHDHFRFRFIAEKVFFESRTEHHHLIIFRNETFGRVMMLDGVIQVAEADEFIYHETLAHTPLFALGLHEKRRVLIIGGGDGGMLREVLRHEAVERAVLCEIDRSVIDMCREHLPMISQRSYDDPRTEIVIGDGTKFVRETKERFDVIIVDSTDPIGPAEVLFTQDFYADCKRCLKPGGVLVNQCGLPFLQGWELTQTMQRFRKSFADVGAFLIHTPTYIGGPLVLGWASDDAALRAISQETLADRFGKAGLAMKYYNPALHKGAFALPSYVQELVDKQGE
ncbi:MAG: polyamine aminopropyltransferase [Rhodomicrobiaceae bacterium]